jgi:integrase
LGDQTLVHLSQLGPRPYEQLYAQLRHCRRRCQGRKFIEHRTTRPHECDPRCKPHVCTSLAASSIRQCHAVLSSAYAAATRWGWIAFNPMDTAQKPRLPAPQPDPPSAEDAARIVAAAWAEDDEWGMVVWTALVTGARRGELLALRWEDVDLSGGTLTIRHSLSERAGAAVMKDTKTHQMRRVSLDEATIELLEAHKKAAAQQCDAIGAALDDCFVFSYAPDCRRPCSPSGITHRYERMVRKLAIRTRLHSMRHYSATELLASGVDLRTVAGRLGHGSARYKANPGMEVARHRSTSPAHLVRALVPLAFYPTPDCGSRMTGDRHVRFCESGRGKLPPATRQASCRVTLSSHLMEPVSGSVHRSGGYQLQP